MPATAPLSMKPSLAQAVLAVLLCQVLAVTQVFAIAGGPPIGSGFTGGGGTTLNLTGTYSGVLQGLTASSPSGSSDVPPAIPGDPDPAPTNPDTTTASSSIGLFDLGVTQTTGLARGTFLLFSDGRVFTGSITGAVDPGSGVLQGILQSSFNFNVSSVASDGAVVTIPVAATALGRLDTAISGATSSAGTPSTTGGTSTASTSTALVTLAGTASLDISFGEVDSSLRPVIDRRLTFSVNGFRNSTTVTPTALTAAPAAGS